MTIFKAYDIRGRYPSQFNEEKAYFIGLAIVELFKPETIVVGMDARQSSDAISAALTNALIESKCKVINIGLVSTPILYHYAAVNKIPMGLMITASHNPENYNGIKLCQNGAFPLNSEQISNIGKLSTELKNKLTTPRCNAGYKSDMPAVSDNPYPEYIESVHRKTSFRKGFKIAVDAGNAICGYVIPKVFGRLPVEIIPLYFELDGRFPNHQPDPLKKENTIELQRKVVEHNCDFGAALDGDGDRVMFIDEKGNYIPGDLATLLIALDFQKKEQPPKKIVIDTRMSKSVVEVLKEHGVEAIRGRVGHSFVKSNINKFGAFFGGELSGHYYFRDNYYAESSDLAIISILNILSAYKKPLSELVKENSRYHHSGEINFIASNKSEIMDMLTKKYDDGNILFIDGVTIEYPSWWMNVRPSNTEDILRLNLEAKTESEMKMRIDEIEKIHL